MGTAQIQGTLWGTRARDWADYGEGTSNDLFMGILHKLNNAGGNRLLDIGCGAGGFCQMASKRGFKTTGFDASENLILIAKERMPAVDFNTGDMEKLPYKDGEFDIATGINSFQFAENIPAALSEAKRVVKKNGKVIISVWSNPEKCDATAIFSSLGPFMPPPPQNKQADKKPLFAEGVLEGIASTAGLKTESSDEITCLWNFENEETAVSGIMSAGLIELAIRNAGEEKIKETIRDAIGRFRQSNGSFILKNTYRCLVTTA